MYVPDIHGRGSVSPDPQSEGFGAARRVLEFPAPNTPLNDSISNEKHLHLFTWLLKSISIAISGDATPSSEALFPSTHSNNSLGKRSSPNTTTSVVAGILVTVFVLLAGAFLYVYRRSVRFRKQARKRRRHRHKRRASKNSQASETVGGGGDGGGDGGAAADAGAQA